MSDCAGPTELNRSPSSALSTPIVFVVDDDISVRQSLELLILSAGWSPECFDCATHFLARERTLVPSCLLLDVHLPDLNGLDLQQRMASERSEMPIIFMSGGGDIPMTVRAMRAGAMEFLTKPLQEEALLSAVQAALERSRSSLAAGDAMRPLREHYESLSRREREVLQLVVCGLLNKQVAGELSISEITVKAHRGNMMRKMHAASLADLVTMASQLGVPRTTRR